MLPPLVPRWWPLTPTVVMTGALPVNEEFESPLSHPPTSEGPGCDGLGLRVRRVSGHVASGRLRMIGPRTAGDRHAEEDDTELDRFVGLVPADVHARGKLDERLPGPVRVRPAVVVVDGEGSGLHRDRGLAWLAVPTGRRVRAEGETGPPSFACPAARRTPYRSASTPARSPPASPCRSTVASATVARPSEAVMAATRRHHERRPPSACVLHDVPPPACDLERDRDHRSQAAPATGLPVVTVTPTSQPSRRRRSHPAG